MNSTFLPASKKTFVLIRKTPDDVISTQSRAPFMEIDITTASADQLRRALDDLNDPSVPQHYGVKVTDTVDLFKKTSTAATYSIAMGITGFAGAQHLKNAVNLHKTNPVAPAYTTALGFGFGFTALSIVSFLAARKAIQEWKQTCQTLTDKKQHAQQHSNKLLQDIQSRLSLIS